MRRVERPDADRVDRPALKAYRRRKQFDRHAVPGIHVVSGQRRDGPCVGDVEHQALFGILEIGDRLSVVANLVYFDVVDRQLYRTALQVVGLEKLGRECIVYFHRKVLLWCGLWGWWLTLRIAVDGHLQGV